MAAKKPAAKTEPTMTNKPPETKVKDWRDPNAKFAADDESLEARMWRLGQRR